ncbi:hypothetical protein AYL99_11877 [Fonsecaea erecta]|uniref:Uncharacterized protein n=1 Tax=Fonsecaea erecta TaxID=1367422 RepID=A0A178Z424_9EURO|nr:hypothetical protein AYL99_11877 [Fonsecaea erecta]OAP53855.1 hypothetical protein AYL99_11877 [Fonsecaea erecta]
MSDIEEVDRLIDFGVSSNATSKGEDDNEGEVGIGRSNKVIELMEAIELEIERLKADGPAERHRNIARLPDPDALRHTKSPAFSLRRANTDTARDEDTESFSTVSRHQERVVEQDQGDGGVRRHKQEPQRGRAFDVVADGVEDQLRDGEQGLEQQDDPKYIQVKGETGHIIDEVALMKVYNAIVPELYSRIMFGGLPAVQSQEAILLSQMFSRTNKNDVLMTTAKSWWKLSQHSEGHQCVSATPGRCMISA